MRRACSLLLSLVVFASFCVAPGAAQAKTKVSYTGEVPIAPKGTMAVFVAPHPDDETFSFGVTIAANVAAGRDVTVNISTDGNASLTYDGWRRGVIPNAAFKDYDGVNPSTPDVWDYALMRRYQAAGALHQFETATNKINTIYLGGCGPNGNAAGAVGIYDGAIRKGDVATGLSVGDTLKRTLSDLKVAKGKSIGLLVSVVPFGDAWKNPASPYHGAVIDPGLKKEFLYRPASIDWAEYADHTAVGLAVIEIGKTDRSIGRVYLANPYASPNINPDRESGAYPVAPQDKALRAKILKARRAALKLHTVGRVSTRNLWEGINKDAIPADYLTSSEHYRKTAFEHEPNEFQRWNAGSCAQMAILGSRSAFPNGARAAVITSSKSAADALVATPLAGATDGPLLFTKYSKKGALESSVKAELARLKVSTVYVVGGEKTVSKKTATAISKAVPGKKVKVVRLSGADKYATSLKVSKKIVAISKAKKKPITGVFVATNKTYVDAYACGSVAAQKNMPIIIAPAKGLSGKAAKDVKKQFKSTKVKKVYVVGKKAALSNAVANSVKKSMPKSSKVKTVRFAGKDRYDTARLITQSFIRDGSLKKNAFAVAAAGCQEGLAAAAAMAQRDGLVISVAPTQLTSSTRKLVRDNQGAFLAPAESSYVLVGGVKAVGIMPEEELHTVLLSLR